MSKNKPDADPFASEGFVVLVEVLADSDFPRREAYVVACATKEESETKIRELYTDESTTQFSTASMPVENIKRLKLRHGEVLPWQ
jgi:hypothetical protein